MPLHDKDQRALWEITERFVLLCLFTIPPFWLAIVFARVGWLGRFKIDSNLLFLSLLSLSIAPGCFSFYAAGKMKIVELAKKNIQRSLWASTFTLILGLITFVLWIVI